MKAKLSFFIIIVSVALLFQFKDSIWPHNPCTEVTEFSIGTVDPQFDLSKDMFISKIEQAAAVWDGVGRRKMFRYNAGAALKINLFYDSRQQVQDELKTRIVTIKDDKTLYDELSIEYSSTVSSYESKKYIYEKQLSDFLVRQRAYEEKVAYYNKRREVASEEHAALTKERGNLQSLQSSLSEKRQELNLLREKINSLAQTLNSLTKKLNINVKGYNNVSLINGEEYSEGEYVADLKGSEINIYQFRDYDELIRIITHELGHALGLNHVADQNAVMYSLNIGKNAILTQADVDEYYLVCVTGKPKN